MYISCFFLSKYCSCLAKFGISCILNSCDLGVHTDRNQLIMLIKNTKNCFLSVWIVARTNICVLYPIKHIWKRIIAMCLSKHSTNIQIELNANSKETINKYAWAWKTLYWETLGIYGYVYLRSAIKSRDCIRPHGQMPSEARWQLPISQGKCCAKPICGIINKFVKYLSLTRYSAAEHVAIIW